MEDGGSSAITGFLLFEVLPRSMPPPRALPSLRFAAAAH